MAYSDLTVDQKAHFFAACEAFGRAGREEVQRMRSRLAEIEEATTLTSEQKTVVAGTISQGFLDLFTAMGEQIPTPEQFEGE